MVTRTGGDEPPQRRTGAGTTSTTTPTTTTANDNNEPEYHDRYHNDVGDEPPAPPDNTMERVFALDKKVLYRDLVYNTGGLIVFWAFFAVYGFYRIVAFVYEDPAMESATSYMNMFDDELGHHTGWDYAEVVLRSIMTACAGYLFVVTTRTALHRWHIITGRRVTVTPTGIRWDYTAVKFAR